MFKVLIIFLITISVHSEIYDVCIPFQWEGVQILLTGTQEGGQPTFIDTTVRVSFDFNNSRMAAFTSGSQDGEHFQRDYLFLYDKRIVYINKDAKCHAESLTRAFPPTCLPKESFNWTMARTWFGVETVDEELLIFGYDGIVKDLKYAIQMFMYWPQGVVAFQQIIGYLDGVPFFQTSHTVNTTNGIKNPDVFTLPLSCKAAELKWEGVYSLLTGTVEEGRPTFIQTTGHVSFDFNHSRIAAFTSGSQESKHFQRDYIFLYDKRVVYINEGGNCHAESLTTRSPSQCIPKNFNWTWVNTRYGLPDFRHPSSMIVIFGYEGFRNGLKYHIDVPAWGPAIVITQQIIGSINSVPVFQTTDILNSTLGIKNPDVFILPSNCKTAEVKGNFTTPASLYGIFLP